MGVHRDVTKRFLARIAAARETEMTRTRSAPDADVTQTPWRAAAEGVVVTCRLTPRSGRDAIAGVAALGDGSFALMARVRAAPEAGRANDALCALLAQALGVPRSRVGLVSGARGRVKRVAISGDCAALIGRLRAL